MAERVSGLNAVAPAALVNSYFVMNNNGDAAPGLQDTVRVKYGDMFASPLPIGATAPAAVKATTFEATGVSKFADGTAVAPGITFAADTNTGFYRPADNTIGFSVAGAFAGQVSAVGWSLASSQRFDWNGDTMLHRDAANVIAQRNGTTAQEFRVYNTFTDASNYERGAMRWNANVLEFGSFNAGTGTARTIAFVHGGTQKAFMSAGTFGPVSNGALQLGSANLGWNKLFVNYTNTATVGAVVIDKAAGRVNIAAGGNSIVVTSSACTAAAHVFAVVSQNDATAYVKNVVPAAGSFTINLGANATAQVSIDFFIVNAD